jgi:hypothetical protein
MNGTDMWGVLDGRVEVPTVLERKRKHAAQTGNVFLLITEIVYSIGPRPDLRSIRRFIFFAICVSVYGHMLIADRGASEAPAKSGRSCYRRG